MYIGIDLGTTGCKTVMFDKNGKALCEYNREYELIFKDGFVEQDANEWWSLICDGLRQVVSKTGISGVKGISVSTQSISFVAVDKNGETLYNAISWLDMRAAAETESLIDKFGIDYLFRSTGKHAEPSYTLPMLMHLKNT